MSTSSEIDSVVSEASREIDSDEKHRIKKDDLFHLLQSSRRRSVVAYLDSFQGEVTIGELAEQVAAWEYEKPISRLTSQERQNVYISLYQQHLEKLEKHNVVRFNKDRGLVSQAKGALQLLPYIDPPSEKSLGVSSE